MKKHIDEKLVSKNIRPTAMRELILEMFEEEKTALSLPELEQKFENADKATIFRTLKTFLENRLIHSINDGSGSMRYALCDDSCTCKPTDLHVHFMCKKCGNTYCLRELPVPQPSLPEGFKFSNASFIVSGICANCKR